jgi:hypothetical protein
MRFTERGPGDRAAGGLFHETWAIRCDAASGSIDTSKKVEPNFAAPRCPTDRMCGMGGGAIRSTGTSKTAQAPEQPMRGGPASMRCPEISYRHGRGSLAIARSASVWASRYAPPMNRLFRSVFPSNSRICCNGSTNASAKRLRAGRRYISARFDALRSGTAPGPDVPPAAIDIPNDREAGLLPRRRSRLVHALHGRPSRDRQAETRARAFVSSGANRCGLIF